ncbi:MAG: hypothetical protein ACKOCA_08480 [Vulcanococcus sp.]
MSPLSRTSLLACALAIGLGAAALPTLAQSGLRSTFPGRRVGGGTRGECSARLIAHLVPANSVYASGADRLLGILQGPSDKPHPLQITFRPQEPPTAPALDTRTLPAADVSIVLLRQPQIAGPTLWESTYQCEQGQAGRSEDPLDFISAGSPPALSLLLKEPAPADATIQSGLSRLQKSCGSTVPREEVERLFGLEDVMRDNWPARIPVRCAS